MPAVDLRIKVEGVYLDTLGIGYGNVQRVDRADGGCYELSFSVTETPRAPSPLLRRGALIELDCAGTPVWAGLLTKPDFLSGELSAEGLSRGAEGLPALTAGGAPTSTPNTAVDTAISLGWRVTRSAAPNMGVQAYKTGDTTDGVESLAALLDVHADSRGRRWGVNAAREVYRYLEPTEPTWFMAPDSADLAIDDENFRTHLVGRYKSGASTFATVTVADDEAADTWGPSYLLVRLQSRGVISSGDALDHLTNLRTKIRARPGWAGVVEPSPMELVDAGGMPADPALVFGGQVVRMLGVMDEATGITSSIDWIIGQVTHDVATGSLALEPVGAESRDIASIVERSRAKTLFQG